MKTEEELIWESYILREMATPSYKMKRRRLYHGTSTNEIGEKILNDGYIKTQEYSKKGFLTPVSGRLYLSQELRYSVIYTIGGDMIGSGYYNDIEEEKRYGWLFVSKGRDLGDIQPDEDFIGKLLYNIYSKYSTGEDKYMNRIKQDRLSMMEIGRLYNILTPNQKEKINEGEYSYFAQGGKKILKVMPEWLKLRLIELGMPLSTDKNIPYSEAWRFDKRLTSKLKRNASNFFELAERIK